MKQSPEYLIKATSLGTASPEVGLNALKLLQSVVSLFPQAGEIFYLLGVVTCSVGNIASARLWLEKAFLIGGNELKLLVLEDEELERVWKSNLPHSRLGY